MENYLKQLIGIVRSETVRKYCKKEAEQAEKVITTYGSLIDQAKETVYSPEVK
jgi:hypothetical protein